MRAPKRARGALDYDDLIAETLRLLEARDAAAWVLYKLDGGLDHMLIDEAQDTSPEQWRIVQRLTEEFFAGEGARATRDIRTIFAVGDEKQSIFSFQGADPAQFDDQPAIISPSAQRRSTHFAGRAALDVSRRSAPQVLRFRRRGVSPSAARARA